MQLFCWLKPVKTSFLSIYSRFRLYNNDSFQSSLYYLKKYKEQNSQMWDELSLLHHYREVTIPKAHYNIRKFMIFKYLNVHHVILSLGRVEFFLRRKSIRNAKQSSFK